MKVDDEKVLPEGTKAICHYLSGPKKMVTFPLARHENYFQLWLKYIRVV
jgi:hypothetical protein